MTDRQVERFADARRDHHVATQTHRDAVHQLEAAAAELVTAGAALAQRVLLTACPVAPADRTQGPTAPAVDRQQLGRSGTLVGYASRANATPGATRTFTHTLSATSRDLNIELASRRR